MDKIELRERLAEGTLSRRELTRAMAAAGVATVTVPMFTRAARAEGEISYFTWAGYDLPDFAKGYVDKYGGTPNFAIFGEEEEAFQKMRAGYTPDIAHPCTYSVGRWRDSGLFKPVDVARLTNYGDIWDDLKAISIAHADGQTWFVPWDWGNSSVLYRTDLVDPKYVEEESWGILFDENYAGRLGVYDAVDGAVIVAALWAGVANPFAMTDEEIENVRAILNEQRPLLRFYWTDQSAVEQGLASGELVAAYAWNASVVALKKQGVPVKYMNPKEGILTWVCGYMLLKDGQGDEQAAYDFIDAALAPESGRYLIDEYGYGHSNRKAFELVSQERLVELAISTPEALFKQGIFFQPIEPSIREKYIAMFEEVKAGS
ncbi:MAG: ABC transporter substrate-binding protein [Alphaproteobacteria bacterium]